MKNVNTVTFDGRGFRVSRMIETQNLRIFMEIPSYIRMDE